MQHQPDAEYRFFNSLARYIPLLLSADDELSRSPALASSTFAYGVFARRRLKDGDYKRSVQVVRGVVPLQPSLDGELRLCEFDITSRGENVQRRRRRRLHLWRERKRE